MSKEIKEFVPVSELEEQYNLELQNNPKYSLKVDPENKYAMSDQQKLFIEYYCQYKSINTVAQLLGMDEKEARGYYMSYASQEEIRRINLAMYQRQFSMKLASLDDLGGYLTAVLTDQVPIADRIGTKDKLKVVELLTKLTEVKREALTNPEIIDMVEVEEQLADLSVDNIKQLLAQTNTSTSKNKKIIKEIAKTKEDIINELDSENNFTPEEKAYLSTLPIEKLKEMVKNES